MADFTISSDASSLANEVIAKLKSSSEKTQLQIITDLAESGLDVLMEFLLESRAIPANIVMGKAYQILFQSNSEKASQFLQTYFPNGIVPLNSDRNIDYTPLQKLLAQQDFQAADSLTLQKCCELAGPIAVKRKWLYFTEVESFPITDLQTIDKLWVVHSEGKFGYSVQREIWLGVEKNWEKFWPKINWKNGNNWTRYPQEFTWDLSAPRGHLPLSNQLRGVRVINSLFNHPAWSPIPAQS